MVLWLGIIPFSFIWYKIIEVPGIALGKIIIGTLGDADPSEAASASSRSPRGRSGAAGRRRRGSQQVFTAGNGLMLAALVMGVAGTLSVSDRFSFRTAVQHANLAWVLATSPDAARRDGALAVELAEDACLQTQYRQAGMVETLAAAYAEAGRFDEATGAARMASALASQAGDAKLLQQNQAMQRRFLQHEAYHEQTAGGQ
jgi:hypothetical protein